MQMRPLKENKNLDVALTTGHDPAHLFVCYTCTTVTASNLLLTYL